MQLDVLRGLSAKAIALINLLAVGNLLFDPSSTIRMSAFCLIGSEMSPISEFAPVVKQRFQKLAKGKDAYTRRGEQLLLTFNHSVKGGTNALKIGNLLETK